MDRCEVCGGTMRLQCEQCGRGGTWLDPVGDGQLACGHCGHTQPALCPDPEHREASQTPALTPARQLRAAADHIERVGLYQGGRFFDPAQRPDIDTAACCVAGALMVVGGDAIRLGGDGSAYFPLKERLERIPKIGAYAQRTGRNALVYWSDHTPEAEVLETLRRIAAEIEAAMPPSARYMPRDTYNGMCDAYRHTVSIVRAAGSVPVATPAEPARCEHGLTHGHDLHRTPWGFAWCPGPAASLTESEWRATASGRLLGRNPDRIELHSCGCVTGWDDVYEQCVRTRCGRHLAASPVPAEQPSFCGHTDAEGCTGHGDF